MKAVGICVLLAQAGSFVPADSMQICPYTSLHSRIWSHDNLWAGLSSFAVEIGELRDILDAADDKSLVLGDEVCSGTESISATSLVAATLEHLHTRGSHFLFATHLHDLLKVPGLLERPGISVFHLRVIRTLEGKLIYDRTLLPGSGSSTYGLEVAKAMGLPFSFMERAYSIRSIIGGEQSVQSSWNSGVFRKSCELCGCTIASELEVHHIEHREDGGSNSPRNLAVVCKACHHKHHDEGMEIPPLQQTSEGAERISVISMASASVKTTSKTSRTDDEMKVITSTLERFKGRPPERIAAALQEEGIVIRAAELKRYMRG
jgi:DNA mismatch repair protein MutS